MRNLEVGELVQIHSYKHNKALHRIWRSATVISESENVLILGNYKTRVIESDGRNWITKEPAICIFYKHNWFNVIGMIKPDGIYYYCNLSSPFAVDEEAVKYIDYDLDIRVNKDGSFKILDEDEYQKHQVKFKYPDEIKQIIENELQRLIGMVKSKQEPFQKDFIMDCYNKFRNIQ